MFVPHNLKFRLETAERFDTDLMGDLLDMLSDRNESRCRFDGAPDLDVIFTCTERIHPGFLYLAWRAPDGHHRCSIALDEHDMDSHRWLGSGATPALAFASALLESIVGPTGYPPVH